MHMDRTQMRAAWLGRVPYRATHDLQLELQEKRKEKAIPDTLLLLEHDPVYTLGRRADDTHIHAAPDAVAAEIVYSDRGGLATYHGPGQLVAYPILNIRNLRLGPVSYVRILEETIIQLLLQFGISGHRVVGKTGVWVGGEPGSKPAEKDNPAGRKIAAIGLRLSEGVAIHGMALNVNTDLGYYEHIIPCGMPGLDVTSMHQETGQSFKLETVAKFWAELFTDILFFELDWVPKSHLLNTQSIPIATSV